MILGLSLLQFTFLHVFLSIVALGSGVFIVFGLITSRRLRILTDLFMVTNVLTDVTGFLFPNNTLTPGIVFGFLSTIALIVALLALYVKKLEGGSRGAYVVSVCIAFYLNVFVLFAQLFAKVAALKALAPTPASPAFLITQGVVFAIFILITVTAFKKFHPA
jgi:hypothetical protein